MNFVSCVAWVRRGIAKSQPDKVSLSKEELKKLLQEKGSSNEQDDDDDDDSEEPKPKRCRDVDDDDIVAQYDLDSYDVTDTFNDTAGLAGLVVYASNEDDENLRATDDDDSSDEDDEIIRPDDNLIAVGHIEGDHNVLEIYVFNQDAEDLYVHHDYLLQSQPLCMEWMDFDPSEEPETKSNLLAVGTVVPEIGVWDLDVVNCMEPAFTLGQKSKKSKKLGHTDAILDISWNKITRNLIASGSADQSIAIWDVTDGTALSFTKNITEKVQSVEWHSREAQLLLAGSYDGWVGLVDCRRAKKAAKSWTIDGEVERVLWNIRDPFGFLVSTDKGFVHYFDSRSQDSLWTIGAHGSACTGLSLSSCCPDALATASTDKTLKLWDIGQSAPTCVLEKRLNVGKTFCLQSSPDSAFTYCFGGDKRSKSFDVQDFRHLSAVRNHFSSFGATSS